MPTNTLMVLPKTESPEEFEKMCKSVLELKYEQDFELYGRKGQDQKGIDIRSKDPIYHDARIVAQCKNYLADKRKSAFMTQITKDVESMSELSFAVSKVIIMTAMDRDSSLQDFVSEIGDEYKDKYQSIQIMFWGEISDIIFSSDVLMDKYYPSMALRNGRTEAFRTHIGNGSNSIQLYYQDAIREWEETSSDSSVLGKESYANAYIEGMCKTHAGRQSILSEIQKYYADHEYGVMLLHGQPGHGKTSFCKFAVYQYAQKKALQSYKNVFRFNLNPTYSEIVHDKKIVLQNALCFDQNGDCISMEQCRGALVFLDGYDELKTMASDTDVKDIISLVKDAAAFARKYQIRFVITSRTTAVENELDKLERADVKVLEFADLSEEEQRAWIYSEKRPVEEQEELIHYWESNMAELFSSEQKQEDSTPYNTLRELLGIPVIFRMVVQQRYVQGSHVKNKAKLYEDLFVLTMEKRGHQDQSFKEKYCNLAFLIFQNNEDTAKVRLRNDSENADYNELTSRDVWLNSYYLTSRKYSSEMEVSFIHRSFYQYFLAEYFYVELKKVTDDKAAEKFLNLLVFRRIDKDIRNLFYEVCQNHKDSDNQEKMTECARTVIHVLGKTSGLSVSAIENTNAGEDRLEIGNTVFVNAINLCIYFNINSMFEDNSILQHALRTYICDGLILHNDHEDIVEENGKEKIKCVCLTKSNLFRARMSSADLRYANLSSANLSYADLSSADLSSADLSSAYLRSAYLRSADLSSAYLRYAYLRSVDLRSADLSYAYLRSADLSYADLSYADLRYADLSSADLSYADLSYADLSYAYLSSVDLYSANLDQAKITAKGISKMFGKKMNNFPLKNIDSAKFDTIYVDDIEYSREKFFAHLDEEGLFHHDI